MECRRIFTAFYLALKSMRNSAFQTLLIFVSFIFPCLTQAQYSALGLGAPFLDNAILQRGKPVPVWGTSSPGAEILVEFGGQKLSTKSDTHGKWSVDLAPLKASSEPREIKVTGDGGSIIRKGILVGEVWFSSGQSNMVWVAGKSMCSQLAKDLSGAEDRVLIRELNITTVSALYPQDPASSEEGWKDIKAASDFSALSLAFANELYKELQVPIGILLSAHSNTRIEAFTQREAIVAHPKLEEDANLILDADPLTEQGRRAYEQYYQDLKTWQEEAGKIAEAGGKVPNRPNLPGIAGMWRGPSQFYNGKIHPVIPYAVRGAIWCQGTSNSSDGRIYAARMEALVNGWRDAWGDCNLPFYFTQMQSYGSPNPDEVGFADIRQAQHLFFINNRKNVGMVVQTDLNSARPQGIHYSNKLHPGMRLARWALAKDYGKDIAYTGPIYSGYKVEGSKVVVSFEKESLFGGLMVGSKGMEKDYREPGKFVEPAQPTPGAKLNHFRLCGEDRKWHAAEAKIVGDEVVVSSPKVPKPIGVQYAYNAVPENSNLYNKAGLPATPFAVVDGEFIFEEDDLEKAAALKARYAQYTDPDFPILQVAEYYRDGVILQRDQPIHVWGHANQGETVTVDLGGVVKKVKSNDLQQWSVTFPSRKASAEPITLSIQATHGFSRTVRNILIGDVWYLTGTTELTNEWAYNQRDKNAKIPEAMPLVREFRRRTAASTFPTPRKRSFETGGGKYRTYWSTADFSKESQGVTMFAYEFAKALGRENIPQGFITMSSGRGGNSRQLASPLSWTSFQGVKGVTDPRFQARLSELLLQYPGSHVARKAAAAHVAEVKAFVNNIVEAGKKGVNLSTLPLQAPVYPEAGKGGDVPTDTIPTYAYNWNVSPLTPVGVAGVIWVPSEANLSEDPAHYAAELEIYAKSLPATYGQKEIQFLYAQPTGSLVEGITTPKIPGAKSVQLETWPKSMQTIAEQLGKLAAAK
jgi:sialate O-acetylesterase